MIEIMQTVLPVLILLALGVICRRRGWITASCVEGMKFLVVKVMIPVAVFHGLATGSFGEGTLISVGILFAVMLITFLLGFALRPLVEAPFNRYLPFVVSVYEGSMMAYPLYASLAGTENLWIMVTIDLAGMLFCFGIFCNVLVQMENPARITVGNIIRNAFSNPAFVAACLGLVMGLTGWGDLLVNSYVGPVYLGIKDVMVAAISPMILLVVGYEFAPSFTTIVPCLKSIGIRLVLQVVFAALTVCILHQCMPVNPLLDLAILVYMSAPGSFCVQTFLSDEEAGGYVAGCNSLYMIVTIGVYILLAGLR